MSLVDALADRVRGSSPHARTALAAECGDRVLPVYEESWVGTYFPEVSRSVELGWTYAVGGTVDPAEVERCRAEVQRILDYYLDEGMEYLAAPVTVALRVLESMSPDTDESSLAVARSLI